jgi:hypothetical protein
MTSELAIMEERILNYLSRKSEATGLEELAENLVEGKIEIINPILQNAIWSLISTSEIILLPNRTLKKAE